MTILAARPIPNGRPFEKGQSGNPGDRPKVSVNGRLLSELAREHTEDTRHLLVAVVCDRNAPQIARVSAAE